jgi:SAM-dependent methyltransferase
LSKSHWPDLHRRWAQVTTPLRPTPEDVERFGQAISKHRDRVLLLGVTPELADLGTQTIGVDKNSAMAAHLWPGNSARRQALAGDWFALPFARGSFSAAIGDGSLSPLPYPTGYRLLFAQLAEVLRPDGRVALRLYKAPDESEPLATVFAAARAGEIRNFHVFKWRLAMALVAVAGDPNLRVVEILAHFEQAFPDRPKLATLTGWPMAQIDTIDVYRSSREVYSFATFDQILKTLPAIFTNPRLIATGSYELAERCPLLVLDRLT